MIVAILLALVAIGVVLWPLFHAQRWEAGGAAVDADADVTLADLEAQRDAIYQQIKDLEFDFRVGKIAEEDYRFFDKQLRIQAAGILKALDERLSQDGQRPLPSDMDARLEQEIAAFRRQLVTKEHAGEPPARSLGDAGARNEGIERFCPQCGALVQPEDRFCSRCGVAL
ncbi:MAG TPA: zinc ribbon domain-containing protein [Anaerolineae bacterium]|nr:zinc ribbon domain-containing protein [Anaerolineae bacterium]